MSAMDSDHEKQTARSCGSDASACSPSSTPETTAFLETLWNPDIHRDFEELRDFAKKMEYQRDEARQETIRTRDFMDHGFKKAKTIIDDAAELLAEIMRDEVNHQDEAEKWLRAYAPQHLFPENAKSPDAGEKGKANG